MSTYTLRLAAAAIIGVGTQAFAQQPKEHDMSPMSGMSMITSPLGISMNRMGSGTSWIPDAVSLPTYETTAGAWDLMAHGVGFAQYDTQGSDRGAGQFGSLNWAMGMATRKIGDALFQARTMLSLEPATVTKSGYPLLLQTGESNDGRPLHDRQHPHDFWMEVAALSQVPLSPSLALELYAAPAGEPALGPVAYMHRVSALDNPIAPIGHHWQDATHISFGVVTAGVFSRRWKLEGSAFNGREPDDERWNFDPLRLDSYSGRLTVNPDSSWSLTAGYGYLASPEALRPSESVHRLTASVLNARTLAHGQWASSLVIGANDVSGSEGWTTAVLIESEAILDAHNTVFGRAETARKSAEELVLPPASFAPTQTFGLGELSLGYIRDVARMFGASAGFGVMGTVNRVPGSLMPIYGTRAPVGGLVFFRLRPAYAAPRASMPGMKMN